MFNFKKIGITLGILGVVGLTGALMAGPAFAGKGGNGNGNGNGTASNPGHQTTICHYQGYESALFAEVDDGTGTGGTITVEVKAEEMEMWMAKMVDADSVDSHKANHSPDSVTYDFVVLFESEGEFEGQAGVNDSAADCTALNDGIVRD